MIHHSSWDFLLLVSISRWRGAWRGKKEGREVRWQRQRQLRGSSISLKWTSLVQGVQPWSEKWNYNASSTNWLFCMWSAAALQCSHILDLHLTTSILGQTRGFISVSVADELLATGSGKTGMLLHDGYVYLLQTSTGRLSGLNGGNTNNPLSWRKKKQS